MKKLNLLFVLTAFAVFSLFSGNILAQSNVGGYKSSSKLHWGLKAGLNLADLPDDGSEMKAGLVIGAFGEWKMNQDFSLSADLLYSQQGCNVEGDGDNSISLDYLNIPILANYYFGDFSIKAGLQLGFLLSSSMEYYGTTLSNSELDDMFSSFDLAIPIGVSYNFDFGLVIDARYNLGLLKVNAESGDYEDINNSVFQITVGYKF